MNNLRRISAVVIWLSCALVGWPEAALADHPFSFESTPGELPKTVVPRHYALRLQPDLKALTTQGSLAVDIQVLKPTRVIVLNALDLQVAQAELTVSNAEIALHPLLHARQQTLELDLPKEQRTLAPGDYRLSIQFTGRINEEAEGLFYAKYRAPSGQKMMLCTQMEPADARRMLPCWDEPVFRATFEVTAVLPEKHLALSNMPIRRETPLGNGLKEVVFERTPPMPSYLLALISGELEAVSGEAQGVKLRVLTTEGKQEQGRYALEAAEKLLPYYERYFQIDYPLPKLDLIAVPGGFSGAMENWGAITFEESDLLFDPASSSQSTKQEVFVTVAHEMAHQWFGNLVTMAWWDNLWLNEGFASWMEIKATAHFNPGWQMWLTANAEKDAVMSRDARRETHPIQRPVPNESAANDAFDSITYEKGQAFLRMLESYLGEADFAKGIHDYLWAHRYSNTTTADLWDALGRASGKPIKELCASWTEQPGLPVVLVSAPEKKGVRTLRLEQERFTVHAAGARNLRWEIPVPWRKVAPGSNGPVHTVLLQGASLLVAPLPTNETVKANAGDTGYYRVWYEPSLFRQLRSSYAQLPAEDRLNLVNDAWAMVEGDRASPVSFLELVKTISGENTSAVWSKVISSLEQIDALQRGRPERGAFHAYAGSVLRPQLERLGWSAKAGEPDPDTLLRAEFVTALGTFEDAQVLARAKSEFVKFLQSPESVSPDLRPAIFRIAGRYSDRVVYDKLHQLAREARGTEDRQLFYRAMASARDEDLAKATLELSLSDEMAPEEAAALVREVAHSGEHPELAWDFFKLHANALLAKVDAFERNNYAPSIADAFSDDAMAKDLEIWVREHLPPTARPKTSEAAENIRFKAWLKRQTLPVIDQWIKNGATPSPNARG